MAEKMQQPWLIYQKKDGYSDRKTSEFTGEERKITVKCQCCGKNGHQKCVFPEILCVTIV